MQVAVQMPTDELTPSADPTPPAAPRIAHIRELHGESVGDDYAWMRDQPPALRAYLEQERAYYDARVKRLRPLAAQLAREAAARLPDGAEYSVSWPVGEYSYRTCVPVDGDEPQLLRSKGGGPERVLLDVNAVAAETGFADVGVREPSPDGAWLAWSLDTSGAEIYELRIRNLETGLDLAEAIPCTYPGVAWGSDSRHLYYLVPDELNRPFRVCRHLLGTPADADVLVHEEPDQRFELTLERSRSGELAIISAESRDTTEVQTIALSDPRADPVVIEPRRRAREYRVDHARGGDLYIVTDASAPEFSLVRAGGEEPHLRDATLVECEAIAPARGDTRLLRCDVLADQLVLTLRRGGEPLLAITDHDGGDVRELRSQFQAGAIRVQHAEDYDVGSVIVAEESLIEPTRWSRLELASGQRDPLRRLEVPGYDPAAYSTERRAAPAPDGTPIPVTLAYRRDTPLDGTAPCLLYGYGAYEYSLDSEFDRSLPSLLDRGVVYAVAHIRGGGECGRDWWQQGRLRAKATTFTDFIAVADWLAGKPGSALVDGDRIASRGGSAGGLLQGAVYSLRPDRWRAVVAEVPFVDVVTTMLDPAIPLTINEWDEWGDPRDPGDYACMRAYSPYDNPPPAPRPALLITGAMHDPRVAIHEPAKWIARLRATGAGEPAALFRPELGAGAHTGPSGRTARFGYEAEVQAFILDALGIGQ